MIAAYRFGPEPAWRAPWELAHSSPVHDVVSEFERAARLDLVDWLSDGQTDPVVLRPAANAIAIGTPDRIEAEGIIALHRARVLISQNASDWWKPLERTRREFVDGPPTIRQLSVATAASIKRARRTPCRGPLRWWLVNNRRPHRLVGTLTGGPERLRHAAKRRSGLVRAVFPAALPRSELQRFTWMM